MQVLNELRLNEDRLLLKDQIVRSPILPRMSRELERDVVVQGACEVEGAIFARNLEVQQGPLRVKGCVYTQLELHVNTDATGTAVFEKAVGSSNAIVSLAPKCRVHFLADVSAKQVKLSNCYVAANIFADEIVLDNCVVIGGVFATRSLELSDCAVGTFNSPVVRISKVVYLLFPSAFSVEKISYLPGTQLFSLTLADLGALMRGTPEADNTGKICMSIDQDEVKTVLSADGVQQILRSYSVVGKVLATGLVDYERLQNTFLISCASMGNQLLHTYDLGLSQDGTHVELTPERIAQFFFSILWGKTPVSTISGEFDLASIVNGSTPTQASPAPLAPVDITAEAAVSQVDLIAPAPEAPKTIGPQPPSEQGPLLSEPAPEQPQLSDDAMTTAPPQPEETPQAVCPACGAEIEEDCAFCENCGKSLTAR